MIRLKSLRWQLTGMMLAAFLLLGAAVLVVADRETRRILRDHTESAGIATLHAHMRYVTDAMLVEDQLALRLVLQDLLETNTRWHEVSVLRADGTVLASASSPGHDRAEPELVIEHPLLGGRAGTLHAVLGTHEDVQVARAQFRRLALTVSVLTASGATAAFLFGAWLAAPLERMAGVARRIGTGELGHTMELDAPVDEVADLSEALNEMSRSLLESRDRLDEQQRQLVHVEKLAAAGTLAAGLAHEVANPIAGVAGCVRRLRGEDLEPDRRARYAELALDGLARASRVLQDLLVFARLGADKTRAADNPERVDVAALLADVVRFTSAGTRRRVQVIGEEAADALWPRQAVAQILTNLLLNALDFAEAEVELAWEPLGQTIAIEIRDDGPGVPEELRDRVFEPFFTTRDPGTGTGLGLAVSAALAQAIGGRIQLLARQPRGTTARVVLPRTFRPESFE